jgi:hypothetical protein
MVKMEASMALTGRYDFKKTFTGKVILRVEEDVPAFWSRSGERKTKRRWRNATLMDLAATEMRALMDMRMKPLVVTRVAGAESNVVVLETTRGVGEVPESVHLTGGSSHMQH